MDNGEPTQEPPDKFTAFVQTAENFVQRAEKIGGFLWKGPVVLIAIGVMGFIFLILYGGNIFSNLNEPAAVRGFITFLIALVTVAIALILVIAAFVTNGATPLKDRFDMAKGVLTALIGILGTIVGFYFGSAEKAKTSEELKPPAIEQVKVDKHDPKQGDTMTLSFQVTGGKAPYRYTVTFPPKTIDPHKDRKSENGKGSEEIKVPDTMAPNTELTPIKIEVKDSDEKTATGEMKEPKILVKAK